MSIALPQVRMEILRGPNFLDDNFYAGWSYDGVGGGSLSGYDISTDGDIATVGSGTGDAGAFVTYKKSASGSTNTYPKAIARARIKNANARWAIQVHYSDETYTVSGWQANTSFSVLTLDLTAGKTIDKFVIYCQTLDGTDVEVEYDYVAICKDALLVPVDETQSDIVESLIITLPLLHRGVGGFTCKLPNMNAEYTGKISDFDHVLIYLWRKGASMKKVFGGKILVPGSEGFGSSQEYYLLLNAMDVGQELLTPPSLLQKLYKEDQDNGKTIIEDAVALCNEVTKKFVDVDNEIATKHSFEFDEVKPHAVITQVCDQAKTLGGVVGFDAYVDPAGNLHVFKRGKYTSSIDLSGKIEHYKKEDDVHRVRNKIKVYGAPDDSNPSDRDAWTESLNDWSAEIGTLSLSTSAPKVGTYEIKCESGIATSVKFKLSKTIRVTRVEHKELHFWIAFTVGASSSKVRLLAPDSSNYFEADLGICTDYTHKAFDLGPSYEYDAVENPDGKWYKTGSPNWWEIEAIQFEIQWGSGIKVCYVDGLYFYPKRWNAIAEDSESQSKYKIRWEEPVLEEGLKSNNECLKKAESLRDFLKDKVTTLSDFRVEGDNGFTPGDRQLVTISNDNINDYFRILEIRHVVHGVQWDTYLTLSNEPQMIDYVFADLHREVRRLSLSKGRGNPGGGCAGERYMAATKVVAPEGYTAEQYDHTTIQNAVDAIQEGETGNPSPYYAVEKIDYYGAIGLQLAISGVIGPSPPPGSHSSDGWPYKWPIIWDS